jgi:hypothetical protein
VAGPSRKTLVLSCAVLRDLVEPQVDGARIERTYMDYGLHVRPGRMAPALQAELDALDEPHTVLIGYGLCGTGLAGLEAGPHTLIIPRTHDCIAILLGSHASYVDAQRERPGTYYITRGWLESENHPLGQYRELLERYDEESADHVIDAMFCLYTRLCFVAATAEELEELRPRMREVADFCRERWGMEYAERVGSSDLIERLLAAPERRDPLGEDFVVVPPGGRVEQAMFERD